MEKKVYSSIDIAKLFFCSCIIALHTNAIQDICNEFIYWYIVRCIYRLAVPFFFVSSGFMIGLKINKNPLKADEYVKKYIQRLFIPLIIFGSINTILEIVKMMINGVNVELIINDVRRAIIFYPYGAMWYVQASIVAICLLYVFIKKKLINCAVIIGILLYAFALVANSYYFLTLGTVYGKIVDSYRLTFISARNGLFVGFLFVGLGIWLSNHIKQLHSREKIKYSVICLIVSYILLIIEVSFVHGKKVVDDCSMFISFIILIPSLVVILTYINSNISNKVSVLVRNLSTGMYFLHRAILAYIVIVCSIAGYTISSLVTFIIVYGLCLFICLISYKHEKNQFVDLLR